MVFTKPRVDIFLLYICVPAQWSVHRHDTGFRRHFLLDRGSKLDTGRELVFIRLYSDCKRTAHVCPGTQCPWRCRKRSGLLIETAILGRMYNYV